MKVLKLSALALSCAMVLTACGGSDSNDTPVNHSNNGSTNIPDHNLTPEEQAQSLVDTAHMFINDFRAVKEVYENASNVLTETQQTRLSKSLDIPSDIHRYMKENSLSTMNAAAVKALYQNNHDNYYYDKVTLMPKDDFKATLSNDGQFNLNGNTQITIEEIDYQGKLISSDSFDVSYKGFQNALSSKLSAKQINNRSYSFGDITVGSGKQKVVLSTATGGLKASASFSDKVVINDNFDIEKMHNSGTKLQQGTATLTNLIITANDSQVKANELTLAFLDISQQVNGKTVIETTPYQLKLSGNFIRSNPKTDVNLSLDVKANMDDIKNNLILSGDDDIQEKAGKYVGMTANLALNGHVTKVKAATIPLDFKANLERTARNQVSLKNLTANVEGKGLTITGVTNLDNNYNSTDSQLIIKQNNAHITLDMNKDNEFVTQGAGKLADIKVGDKAYGQLYKNGGKVTAKIGGKVTTL